MENKYHFIAIGGVGMSGLAKYLLQKGVDVSGSDLVEGKYTQQLKDLGGKIYIGHSEDNVSNNEIIVVSSAIKSNNPELKKAKDLNLPILHRSDLLNKISKDKSCFIGFSGTHGKTTTSGMCSFLLEKAGLNPSFVVGGFLPEYNTNAEYSENGNYFIAEIDESDGTIVKYSPNIVVVNNLEADHLDYYKNGLKDVLYTFDDLFLSKLNNSKIIVNIDDAGVKQLKGIKNYITYGLNEADYTANNIIYNVGFTEFDVYFKSTKLARVKIVIPGKHNVYNTLAVIAAIHQSGVQNIEEIVKHLTEFTGMGRRFQKVAQFDEIVVYDDYAHHPTEIKSTLSALHSYSNKNIVAVFQPHRYSRLKSLWNEFKAVFNDVENLSFKDRLIVTDVYSASENEIEGITGEAFAKELNNAEYVSGEIAEVAKKIYPSLKNNTVIIGLGAGSITNLGKELKNISEKDKHGA